MVKKKKGEKKKDSNKSKVGNFRCTNLIGRAVFPRVIIQYVVYPPLVLVTSSADMAKGALFMYISSDLESKT